MVERTVASRVGYICGEGEMIESDDQESTNYSRINKNVKEKSPKLGGLFAKIADYTSSCRSAMS